MRETNKKGIFLALFFVSIAGAFLTSDLVISLLLRLVIPEGVNLIVTRPVESLQFKLRFGVLYCLFIWAALVFWCTLWRKWKRRLSLVVSIIMTAAGLAFSVCFLRMMLTEHADTGRRITGSLSADFALSRIHIEIVPAVGAVLILGSYVLNKRRKRQKTTWAMST
ncbi:MAG: hypothetical protein ACYTEQ_15105 [Planctomycetota bacterium]|jgi:hypothetical protein